MTIEFLKQNISREKEIIREIIVLSDRINNKLISSKEGEKIINSLFSQLKVLNNAIPDILKTLSFYKMSSVDVSKSSPALVNVNYQNKGILSPIEKTVNLTIRDSDKDKLLKNLALEKSEALKINLDVSSSKNNSFGSSYAHISNKFFREISVKLVKTEFFNSVKSDLRKISSPFLITSYVSMLLLTLCLSFFVSLFLSVIMLFLNFSLVACLGVLVLIPFFTFFTFYQYPSSEKRRLEKEINQELPFLTIFMSAISSSGIEPSKIFDILISSKDYPATSREIKKLNNYTHFYGYDLVSALRLSSKNCPSERLSLLFDGLSTSITSGGSLTNFLDKHSETLLFDYRLEREKYTRTAETFMNVYISVLVAAPMIMMMLFILMGITGAGGGLFNSNNLSVVMILVITFLNILFLFFLNSKQPKF